MASTATPMVRQYNHIKGRYEGYILMFRLGDFYEMFNEDAKIASQVLNIALTKKHVGDGQTCPLAGIPYHSIDTHLAKFIRAGYKVAICRGWETARGLIEDYLCLHTIAGGMPAEEQSPARSNDHGEYSHSTIR